MTSSLPSVVAVGGSALGGVEWYEVVQIAAWYRDLELQIDEASQVWSSLRWTGTRVLQAVEPCEVRTS